MLSADERAVLRELQQARAAQFLGQVVAVFRQPEEKPAEPVLPAETLNLMVKAALEPEKCLTELYSDLRLHPAVGKKAVAQLEALAMCRVHVLARKGRGGAPHGLEVLPAGVAVLRGKGITPAAKLVSRGGWRHDVYGRWISRFERSRGSACSFEQTVGDKVFDVVAREKTGLVTGYEIVLSGSVRWNADQATKAALVLGMNSVVVAAEDARLLKAIQAQVEQDGPELHGEASLFRNRTRFVLMGEFSPF